jgi:hypothetical protein
MHVTNHFPNHIPNTTSLTLGADITAESEDGKVPFDLAASGEMKSLLALAIAPTDMRDQQGRLELGLELGIVPIDMRDQQGRLGSGISSELIMFGLMMMMMMLWG